VTVQRIVVFADLVGSTGLFEQLGNARATTLVKGLTDKLGTSVMRFNGHVVKVLGDGVFAIFDDPMDAVSCACAMQDTVADTRYHGGALALQVGVSSGEVEERDGDCYGDAVNSAARLADLAGGKQILTTAAVVDGLPTAFGNRLVSLDRIQLRGKAEATHVYRVQWESGVTQQLTAPASFSDMTGEEVRGRVEIGWLDQAATIGPQDTPYLIGRTAEARFVVADQRVSRVHAQVDCRAGKFFITDVSSNGTWVRFAESGAVITLKRDESMLVGSGDIALGVGFDDFMAPTVTFRVYS
jgi:adenylate cyclase